MSSYAYLAAGARAHSAKPYLPRTLELTWALTAEETAIFATFRQFREYHISELESE